MIDIGVIVNWIGDDNPVNRYVVVANCENDLTLDYIDSLKGNFTIEKFRELAKDMISVKKGFDYKVIKMHPVLSSNYESKLVGRLIDAFESDIFI